MRKQTIAQLRKKIDSIDTKLISLLAGRHAISREISHLKQQNNEPITQKQRERELTALHEKTAATHDINPHFIKKLFSLIIRESKEIQKKDSKD